MKPAAFEYLAPDTIGGTRGTPVAVVCAVLDAIAPHGRQIDELPLRPETAARALAQARTRS